MFYYSVLSLISIIIILLKYSTKLEIKPDFARRVCAVLVQSNWKTNYFTYLKRGPSS